MIREEAATHGLDPYLVAAVIQNESGFEPSVKGKAGEVGLMQVFPRGSRAWFRCPEDAATLARDARANVRCGVAELAHWRERCAGDGDAWLGGYNVGRCDTETGARYARRVLRLLARGRGESKPLRAEWRARLARTGATR